MLALGIEVSAVVLVVAVKSSGVQLFPSFLSHTALAYPERVPSALWETVKVLLQLLLPPAEIEEKEVEALVDVEPELLSYHWIERVLLVPEEKEPEELEKVALTVIVEVLLATS